MEKDINKDLKENLNTDEENINLKQIFSIFLRRTKLFGAVTLILFSGSVVFTIYERFSNPIYKGNFGLMISDPIDTDSVGGASTSGFESLAKNESNVDVRTLKIFLKSPIALKKIVNEFNISNKDLRNIITIKDSGPTAQNPGNVLDVSIIINNYELGQKILSRLSETYIDLAIEMRQKRLNDGLDFLNSQAPAIQKKSIEAREKLSEYRKKYTFIDPINEGLSIKNSINKYKELITSIKLNIINLERIKEDVATKKISTLGFKELFGNETSSLKLQISNSNSSIINQALQLEEMLLEAKGKFNNNSSIVQNLESNLNLIRPSVIKAQLESIDIALELYKVESLSYEMALENLQKEFVNQPEIIRGYEDIKETIMLNDENLKSLAKSRDNFRLEIAQKTAPWTIIYPPMMQPKPVAPNILRYLAYGAFLSISLGALITYLRDRFDNVYHNPSLIVENLGSISLGLIPYLSFFQGIREEKRFILESLDKKTKENKSNKTSNEKSSTKDNENKINSYERFFYQEAFRNISTSIRFLESDKEINIITITSSVPAEGKTLANILLAKTYSELDKKVLLIDGDLRKPQLHQRLGMDNILGLSNILTDTSLDLSKVIKNVKGYENWDVITSGFIPPDPPRLLSSSRMKEFIKSLRDMKLYDIVIFDCPPVIGLADASLIAEKTDGIILLVTLDKVPKGLPLEAKKVILNSGSEFLGVIINAVKENKNILFGKKGYGYGGYGYGYGYGGYGYGGYGYGGYGYGDIYSAYSNDNDSNEEKIPRIKLLNQLKDSLKKFIKWLDN